MKIKTIIASYSIALLGTLSAHAQGAFQNLNFEQANPVSAHDPVIPTMVTAASALPNWTVTVGGIPQTGVDFNSIFLGAPGVALIRTDNPYGIPVIDGNYSVILQGSGPPEAASISQTGLIPVGTQTLLFKALPNFAFDVLVGTQIVPVATVGSGLNYILYGANISAWAGQTEQLTFSALGNSPGPNNLEIDDISFSTVPEPSIGALTALGGLLFGARKWGTRQMLNAEC